MNTLSESIVVFHISRGGRFFNAGNKTFEPIYTSLCDVVSYNDSYHDIECDDECGTLDIDGEYDTWIAKYVCDCDDYELTLISDAIKRNEMVSSDVCEYFKAKISSRSNVDLHISFMDDSCKINFADWNCQTQQEYDECIDDVIDNIYNIEYCVNVDELKEKLEIATDSLRNSF